MYKKNQVRVIKTEKSTAFKYLQGIWIIPHAADIRIVFKNDSTFEFHDYNSIKDSIEILKGIYVLIMINLHLDILIDLNRSLSITLADTRTSVILEKESTIL